MDPLWSTALWQQFGATIDMLENALLACPSTHWHGRLCSDHSDHPQPPESAAFWYITYHTLFFLDLYLSGSLEGFAPPAPFTLDELDPAGLLPERPYTKNELQIYLQHGRKKCRAANEALTDESGCRRCGFEWLDVSVAELLLYNMRHVQHHAAQLNLILRQRIDSAPR